MSSVDSNTSLVVPAYGDTIAAGRWPACTQTSKQNVIEFSSENFRLHRMLRRLLFPAFGAPTMATWTPLRSLSPLLPSLRCSVISFWSRITSPLTACIVQWLVDAQDSHSMHGSIWKLALLFPGHSQLSSFRSQNYKRSETRARGWECPGEWGLTLIQ